MNLWIKLLVSAPLAGAVLASPAAAQDLEWDDDDSPFHDFAINLDRQFRNLDEQLQHLDDGITFDFAPDFLWAGDYCDDGEDCDVRIIVKDGERFVIVNGDTVETRHGASSHPGRFSYKYGPRVHLKSHGPGKDFVRNFTGLFDHYRDGELRRLEREARDLAREARQAEDAEKTSIEEDLDRKLNEIFDYKMERQKESIAKAEDRVAEMKERRSKRESAREEIIRNRKDELLGRDRYLEW